MHTVRTARFATFASFAITAVLITALLGAVSLAGAPSALAQEAADSQNAHAASAIRTSGPAVPSTKAVSIATHSGPISRAAVEAIPKNKTGANAVAQASLKTMSTYAMPRKKQMRVDWAKVAGATNYLVGYKLSTSKAWSYVATGGANSYTFNNMKEGTLLEFRVAVYSNKKKSRSEWTQINCRFFREMVSLKATVGVGKVDLKWTKVPSATGYRVLVATKSDMSDARAINIDGGNTLSCTARTYNGKAFVKGKTYYLRVCPVKKAANTNGKTNTYVGIYSLVRTCKITQSASYNGMYTVKFDGNGGTFRSYSKGPSKTIVRSLSRDVEATVGYWYSWTYRLSREGYELEGWALSKNGPVAYLDNQLVKNLAPAGKSITLYAKWKKILSSYTIKFDANGGTGTMRSQSAKAGIDVKLAKNRFKRTGFTFMGWTKDSDFGIFDFWTPENQTSYAVSESHHYERIYEDEDYWLEMTPTESTLTLYAVWKRN